MAPDELDANRLRAKALPMFGDGYIPPDRDRAVESDNSGFREVLALFFRSWPYIRPQLLGRWYVPGAGVGTGVGVAEAVEGGYSFAYAPFLVVAVAVLPLLFGAMPATFDWPMGLLYVPVLAMILSITLMVAGLGRRSAIVLLVASGLAANIVASFLIDGSADGIYAGAVTLACVFGWMFQFRREDGRVQCRIRIGTHLVYYYAINFLQRFIALALGVILADLLSQNILQNEPIAPGLASLIGIPEWAQGSVTELDQEQRRSLVWVYVLFALGAHLAQLPFRIVNPYYNMWIMQRINQDLRLALLERWHQLSLKYHSDHRTGDTIFRIYQDSAQVTAVIGRLITLTLATMSYLTCVFLVSLLSPWLGFLAVAFIPPAMYWAYWSMPRMRTRALVYRAAASDVTSRIQESFSAIKLIKAFGTADRAQRAFEEDSVIAFNASYRMRILTGVVTIVMFTIGSSFMIGGEFLLAAFANEGRAAFAVELIALVGVSFVVFNLAAFNWTKEQFAESTTDLRGLLRNWLTAQDMAMGLRRVFDILDIEPDVKDRTDARPFVGFEDEIRYDNVSFAYEEDRPVLTSVSLTAKPGTITAIIGPTGSGKSTLMTLLLRLFDADDGAITIDGVDIRDFEVDSLRSQIAVALQENILFAMSVRDNIRYVAADADDDRVREAIRIACMDDYVDGLPEGLDTMLSDRGGKLSTGQRQRLSIARAVVRKAPVMILDEPTAALDAATEHRVMTHLADWVAQRESDGYGGRAIFLITHRISTIQRADNILYLDQGTIVERGDHETLMKIPDGRYRGFVEAESNLIGAAND
jgi:ABC-type multidrug transport system fused ATPase/permease subunit